MTIRPDPMYEDLGWEPCPHPTGRVPFVLRGRRCWIDPIFVPLWTEIERALDATGYENPCDFIGTWNYRPVATGKPNPPLSHHGYLPGIAFDLDYGYITPDRPIDKNPHLHRKVVASDYGVTIQLLRPQVDALLSIRTVSGKQALRWLGDLNGDSMHFDVQVTPADIASGIVPYGEGEDDVTMPTDRWAKAQRDKDVEQMATIGVIDPDEATYFIGLLHRARDESDTAVTWEYDEFQNLRDAWDARNVLYR